MTIELEKQFFECFELEIPMVKTVEYDNDPFAHCDDWWYGERTFEEAGLENYTVNGLNQAIKEFKEKNPEEIKHNGVRTHKYRIIEAFIKYPQITDRHYLELICVSNKELIRRFDISGSDLESIKKNILSQCMKDYTFYSNTLCETYNRLGENFKHQVQAIFDSNQ